MSINSTTADYAWGLPNQFNSNWLWFLRVFFALSALMLTRKLVDLQPGGLILIIMTFLYAYLLRVWTIKYHAAQGKLGIRCIKTAPFAALSALVPNAGMFLTHIYFSNIGVTNHLMTIYLLSTFAQVLIISLIFPLVWEAKQAGGKLWRVFLLAIAVSVSVFYLYSRTAAYNDAKHTSSESKAKVVLITKAPKVREYPSWKEVIGSEEYRNMPFLEKERLRSQYFFENIAPQLPIHEQEAAWKEFYSDTAPDVKSD